MPAYNSEKYISASIQSVLNQTYHNWELILIDDGSVDNTISIIKSFEAKDNRIRFYQNENNIGVSRTRNKAISLAIGNWVAFLDSDDIWKSEKLEVQLSFAQKYKAEFIFTGSAYINEEGIPLPGILQVPQKVNLSRLNYHNVISCSSVLLKKNFFTDVKMEDDSMHEDYAVWLKILKKGKIAYGIDKPLLIYRISGKSKSGNKLKSFKMTFRAHKAAGTSNYKSLCFVTTHLLLSIRKYFIIHYAIPKGYRYF